MIEILLIVSIVFNIVLYCKKQEYIKMIVETQKTLQEKELELNLYKKEVM